jgi:hypothetical protein
MAQFNVAAPPAARQVAAIDFSGIQGALAGLTQIAQEVELSQAERQAARAQRELGTDSVAEPTGFMMPGARRAFEDRANKVYLQELALGALRNETLLRQQHRNDPDGFQSAWELYTEESTKNLEKTNPDLAVAARSMLVEQGINAWSGISDQAFKNELTLQEGETLRQIDELLDVFNDRILDPLSDSDQRDLDFDEALSVSFDVLTEAVQDGRIKPEVFNTRVAQLEDNLRGEWVRGNVAAALADGRHGEALGYIEALHQGAWFTNNDKARALANTLQSDINRALAGQSDYVKNLQQNAAAEMRLRLMGMTPPPETAGAIDRFMEYAAASGSPEIEGMAESKRVDWFATEVLQNVDGLGIDALQELPNIIVDPRLDPRIGDALFDKMNTRLQEIGRTLAANDNYGLLELYPNATNEQIAANLNIGIEVLPIVRPSSVAAAYELAQNTNDATPLAELGMQAIEQGGGVTDVAAAAMEAAERGFMARSGAEAVAMASMVWGEGNANLANRIFADAAFTTTDPVLAGVNFTESFKKDSELFQVLSAMAGHDPEMRTAFRNALNNMYRAELARSDDPRKLIDSGVDSSVASNLVKEFTQIPVANVGGRSYPLSWFGTPDQENQRQALANALDTFVSNLSEQHSMMLRVFPNGDGSFVIYAGDTRNIPVGTFVPEQTQIIRDQQAIEVATIADSNAQAVANPEWLSEIYEDNPVIASQVSREQFNIRVNSAARLAGIEQEDFRRLAVAVLQSSPQETANRFGPMALNVLPDELNPFSLDHSTITERDAAAHFKSLLNQFDTVDQAIAAYWSNATQVQYFIDQFGDEWLNNVPGNVREFVYRAKNANTEFSYDYTVPIDIHQRSPALYRRLEQGPRTE